jgi:hypothetical protein
MESWQILAMIFGPAGAGYMGVKASLNGTQNDVREIKKTLSKIGDNLEDNRIRVAVLEAIQRGDNVQRER